MRTLMPVWDSSGESRFIRFCDVVPLDAWTENESQLKRRYVL